MLGQRKAAHQGDMEKDVRYWSRSDWSPALWKADCFLRFLSLGTFPFRFYWTSEHVTDGHIIQNAFIFDYFCMSSCCNTTVFISFLRPSLRQVRQFIDFSLDWHQTKWLKTFRLGGKKHPDWVTYFLCPVPWVVKLLWPLNRWGMDSSKIWYQYCFSSCWLQNTT